MDFATDRAITSKDQDILERAAFAHALTTAVASWRKQESLVIGLTGNWGCGKSSIKNMVVQELKQANLCQLIEFNPWEWASQESLSAAFFEDISLTIRRKDKSKYGKKLAKALRQYGRRLTTGADMVDGIAKHTLILFASVSTALSGFASEVLTQTILSVVSLVAWAGVLTPTIRKIGTFLSDRSKVEEDKAKDNESTLSEVRQEIHKLLIKKEHPLVIVLDDLDRLSADQMRAIFQLVKANMAFPNVVFLLLFQRDVVERGLQRAGFEGADYLEKIIQVPFSVPVMPQLKLEEVLNQRLEAILASEPQLLTRFDKNYWHTMFSQGLRPFFSNLRNVYRYTSTLAFHSRLLRGTEVAEVSAVDLFALECLRIFSPDTYANMSRHKVLLTDSNPISRRDTDHEIEVKKVVDELVTLAPEIHRNATRRVIELMFPGLDWALTHPSSHRQQRPSVWLADSRVCRAEVFDRYFELSLPIRDITNSLLSELVSVINDAESFCSLFGTQRPELQREILNRLEGRVEDFPIQDSPAVVRTFIRLGESVREDDSSLLTLSSPMLVCGLLQEFLCRHPEEHIRSQLLLDAFNQEKSFVTLNFLLGLEYSRRTRESESYLDFSGFQNLKRAFSNSLIETADSDPDAFISHWNLVPFLYRLNNFHENSGTNWAKLNINNGVRFLKFSQAAASTAIQSSEGNTSHYRYISIKTLDDLLGIDSCKELIHQSKQLNLKKEDIEALSLVENAISRYDRGEKSDFD
ncbi:KAP family P-loop NTPase fold protein [Pseudomonas sp. RHF3.3-3]|uniref:KAP family P-loop NTPase fold protein n=1 Tax=Pseudomonas sp. RHF3.3-3 TaxID=3396624 RepID=UPI003A85D7C0